MFSIFLRVDEYLDLARASGHLSYEQQANAAGLGVGTIHRLRNGSPASSTAVAALLTTYGTEFSELFTIGAPAEPVEPTPEAVTAVAA